MRRRHTLAAIVLALAFFVSGFTPFTRVKNVCPNCPGPKTDVVILSNGMRVPCNLVAQNLSYYVIERHGEYRAVLKTEVASVEWKDSGGPANLGTGDQILLTNGVVLHGAITAEKQGLYFEIQVGSLRHVIWVSQIRTVHRGGTPYPIPTS